MEIFEELVEAFRLAVAEIVKRSRSKGWVVYPSEQFQYSWFDYNEHGGYQLLSGRATELTYSSFIQIFSPDFQSPAGQAMSGLIKRFEAAHGLTWSGWDAKLIFHYFSVEVALALVVDEDAIQRTIRQYIAELEPPFVRKTTLLLRDFSAYEPFTLAEGISFRPMLASDYPIMGREPNPFGVKFPYPKSIDWICEIRRSVSTLVDPLSEDSPFRIVAALGLVTTERAEAYVFSTEFEAPFLKRGRAFDPRPIITSRRGAKVELTEKKIVEFRHVYPQLCAIDEQSTLSYLGVPLRRLLASASRTVEEDSLIDLVIGLESLLAPDSENLEVTFRFRLRGALLLARSFGTARERLAFLSSLYRARSRAVHGKAIPGIGELCFKAETALKGMLRWFLDRPDAFEGAERIVEKLDALMCDVDA